MQCKNFNRPRHNNGNKLGCHFANISQNLYYRRVGGLVYFNYPYVQVRRIGGLVYFNYPYVQVRSGGVQVPAGRWPAVPGLNFPG